MERTALDPERLARARRRGLRAAQAVSLLLFAAGTGCAATVLPFETDDAAADSARAADASTRVDAPVAADVATTPQDSGGCNGQAGTPAWSACCDDSGWNAPGCVAWGPFVPPDLPLGIEAAS